jgi:hypothetical protein
MGVKYDLVAVTGEYTTKDGQTKKRYAKCGVVIETRNGGLMAKFESVPVCNWDGVMYLNEPREKDAAPKTVANMADDVPF